ncbi:MAG: hypothetical protein OEX22_00415 [Cyclobacteriaceae bacterium]|nr:hypothetical protein [Cyclobacteriaceae bacterium]
MKFFLKSKILSIAFISIQLHSFSQEVEQLPIPYLSFNDTNVIYDMSMSYKKYYGSGLLVLKRQSKSNYHGVFLSKMGLKLMEFKIIDGVFVWKKMIQYLDKKSVRKIMERDFAMLMLSDVESAERIKKKTTKNDVMKYKVWSTRKLLLEVDDSNIVYIENRGGFNLTKTKIVFDNYEKNTPKSLNLTHNAIKVKLQLELLEQ